MDKKEIFHHFKTPQVLPVKEEDPDPRIKPVHPNIPQPPALILGIGSVKSGKTILINSMLFQSREDGFYGAQDYFDEVHIISNTINNDPNARFLKKAFNVTDYYTDGMITDLIATQDSYGSKKDMKFICLFADDILGTNMKRNNEISYLATRFRHKNIGLMAVFVQNFKSADTILRNNATDVFIFKQSNNKQLQQIAEEYCSMFGTINKFYEIYKKATAGKYQFLYLKVQEGKALRSFEEVIWNVDTDLDPNIDITKETIILDEKLENNDS